MPVRLSRIGKIGTVGLARFEHATRAIRQVTTARWGSLAATAAPPGGPAVRVGGLAGLRIDRGAVAP
jgi:hypothetical protein